MFQQKRLDFSFVMTVLLLIVANDASGQDDFYGSDPDDFDPAVSQFAGALQGNGTLSGFLPAEDAQSGQLWAHVVFHANSGDSLTVDTHGSDSDTKLAILFDINNDGIQIGDAPRFTGNQLSFEYSNDDDGALTTSLVNFMAPYSGEYLASIAEFDDEDVSWILNVSGSTYTGGLACDFDGDGSCNATDIDLLYANGNAAQVATWLSQASVPSNPYLEGSKTFVIGDVNLDGSVDSTDLGILLNNFNSTTSPNWGDGNLDGDGVVASTDLGRLLNNFNHQSRASAVPEPDYLPLTFMAIAFVSGRRRK